MIPQQEFKEPRRKRIVISLDKAKSNNGLPRRGRLWLKVVAGLGVLVIAISVVAATGAYFWWRHYKSTPAYSVALLIDAAQRNDQVAIDHLVDMDKIVDDLTAQVTEKAAGRYGPLLSLPIRKQVETLAPGVIQTVKQTIREALATRVREIAESTNHKPFVIVAISVPYFLKITTEGERAKATATVAEQPLELVLERSDETWKVVAIKDSTIVEHIADQVVKGLPPIGQQPGEPEAVKRFKLGAGKPRQRR